MFKTANLNSVMLVLHGLWGHFKQKPAACYTLLHVATRCYTLQSVALYWPYAASGAILRKKEACYTFLPTTWL